MNQLPSLPVSHPARRPSALVRVVTHAPLMALLACSTSVPSGPLSTFCPQNTVAGSGNVDKPSGVALAVKTRGDGSQTAYAVVVEPDLRRARALDLTAGSMVPAPNVYFPMAVKMGPYTEDVAPSSDGNVVVALDVEARQLRFIDTGSTREGNAWRRRGGPVDDLDARPTGMAVHGPQERLTIAVSHAGDPAGSVTLIRWNNGVVEQRVRVDVPGTPSGVALVQDGALAVVSAADADGTLTVLDLSGDWAALPAQVIGDCSAGTRPCSLKVGGPCGQVVAGTVPGNPEVDAPRYPLALVIRADRPAVSVVRLRFTPPVVDGNPAWAERMRSTHDRLAATVMLPEYAQAAALAPSGSPRCCYSLTTNPFSAAPAALQEGGFAYAVLALVNGNVAYLDLDARDLSGVRSPRLMDTNDTPPGPIRVPETCAVLDVNQSPDNYVEPGVDRDAGTGTLSGNRPVLRWEPTGELSGDPPVVQQDLSEDYVFRWMGALPGVKNRRMVVTNAQLQQNLLVDAEAGMDLVAAGVRPGDLVDLPPQDGCDCPTTDPACTYAARMEVVEVAGNTVRVDGTFEARNCFGDGRAVAYVVRARDAFTVEGGLSGEVYGRTRFFETLRVPGVAIQLLPAGWTGPVPDVGTGGAGTGSVVVVNPPPVDSVLVFPMRSNFEPFILDLDDRDALNGRFFHAGAVPTGLATAFAPVRVGTAAGGAVQNRAVGIMSTAGSGLLFQFDLGVYPACGDPGSATCISATQCQPRVSRANSDLSFRFYE